jgi:hypothetical protein
MWLCGSVGTRTLDPLIKSQLLYQLSYETCSYRKDTFQIEVKKF